MLGRAGLVSLDLLDVNDLFSQLSNLSFDPEKNGTNFFQQSHCKIYTTQSVKKIHYDLNNTRLIEQSVASEKAQMVLPQTIMTE